MATRVAKSSVPEVSDGTYECVCQSVEEAVVENSPFGSGQVLKFKLLLNVFDEEGNNIELTALCNDVFSPSSKFWEWCIAFGFNPRIGQPVDLEDFRGREALCSVEHRPGSGKNTEPRPRIKAIWGKPAASKVAKASQPNLIIN
jgi:hypothetical protein